MLDMIAFDADDTLWHTEILYTRAQSRLKQLLAPYHPNGNVVSELYETEMGNLGLFGYGINSFALSMIETAIRITDGQIDSRGIRQIIDLVKEMKQAPVHLLDHVGEVVSTLSESHTLMLITKGDLLDQQTKLARSGLAAHFCHVEVVTEKTPGVYRSLLERHSVHPQRFLMVGNSLRSDILPVISLGAQAVYIPYEITWAHETVPVQPGERNAFKELEHMGLLPELVKQLGRPESAL